MAESNIPKALSDTGCCVKDGSVMDFDIIVATMESHLNNLY
jgi:hypothetical protein